MIDITCLCCQKVFTISPCERNRRKYCSMVCRSEAAYGMVDCKYCGEPFRTMLCKKRQYCGQECIKSGSAKSRKERSSRETRECLNCNNDFTFLSCRLKTKDPKYCSVDCLLQWQRKNSPLLGECSQCGETFKGWSRSQIFCSNKCRGQSNVGKKKTGFWYENGYKVLALEEGKGIKEHIHIIQEHLGRKLDWKKEVVHHINGIKDDNRLDNLQVMSPGNHIRLHRQQDIERGKPLFGREL